MGIMKKTIKVFAKVFAAGLLVCLLISTTAVWADTGDTAHEILTEINVMVNNQHRDLPDDMRPFVSNNELFLPLRAISEALDIPVEWDSDTFTVYIGQGSQERVDKTHLEVAVVTVPWSLDPIASVAAANALFSRQVFDTLVDLDYETREVLPALAIHWNMPDAQTVNMELRPGVTFHNGAPLTAYDVQFSLERGADSPYSALVLGVISHVTVHDNYNFTIHLVEPFAPILRNLASPIASIVHRDTFLAHGGDSWYSDTDDIPPMGTGPFVFDSSIPNVRIELTKNHNYWGTPSQIDTLTMRAAPDGFKRFLELEAGSVDIAFTGIPMDLPYIQASSYTTVMRTASLNIDYLGFNMTKAPWDNPLVIQAINYALDTQYIIDTVFDGVGSPALGPLSSLAWGFAETEPFTTNLDRARALLAEAGYPNGFGRPVEIWWNIGNSTREQMAEIVQETLAQIGIEAVAKGVEWAAYLDSIAMAEHDMFFLGWVAITGDADYGLFDLFHSSAETASFIGLGGTNRTHHNSPTLDELLEQGRAEMDPVRRREIYAQALEELRNNPSMVPIRQGEHVVVVSNDLSGFTLDPVGNHRFNRVFFGSTMDATDGTPREINVVVNDRRQIFSADMRPFIYGDRTFLSIRAVSEALDIPVVWDEDTNTVYVG